MYTADSLTLRNELIEALLSHYEGSDVTCEIEKASRNSFCVRVDNGPIFTVTVSYGGMLTAR